MVTEADRKTPTESAGPRAPEELIPSGVSPARGVVSSSALALVQFSSPPPPGARASTRGAPHFRAHRRRPVRLAAVVRSERDASERAATVVDLHGAGAGIETDVELTAGERVTIAFVTPTLWDPIVLTASVAWAHPVRPKDALDALGRPLTAARAGLAFEYAEPEATLAVFEMLMAIAP